MQLKRLFWIGSSDDDLKELPKTIQRAMGYGYTLPSKEKNTYILSPCKDLGALKYWKSEKTIEVAPSE